MSGVCRAFQDTAGGLILDGIDTFLVDGMPICVEGNAVQDHGDGDHNNAVMTNGIPVCTEASRASCGHTPTGSSTFLIG